MNPYLLASGIRLNDCLFTEPVDLPGWRPPQYAGLFAVFVHDTSWAPKPLQPLCFGEFGNNAPRIALLCNYNELAGAANGRKLMIAVCPMPYSTTVQRRSVRDELIWAYNPACQGEGHTLSPGANAFKPYEALPSPTQPQGEQQREPRRRIGFMPDCGPAR
jgi:hypothetical protein